MNVKGLVRLHDNRHSADLDAGHPVPDDGPPCHDCGRAVWYNAWVSDEVWERVRPEPGPPGGGGVLCAHCIDARCTEAGIQSTVRMHWTGESLEPAECVPTDDQIRALIRSVAQAAEPSELVRQALERILYAHEDDFAHDHDAAIQHGHDVLNRLVRYAHPAPQDSESAEVERLRKRVKHLREALKPFAAFACDEPHVGEPDCHNCIARAALNTETDG